jgi:prepilin-type N-terminal cleavage/methylation domain-containing protein
MKLRAASPASGFSLIEILLAVALAGVSLAVLTNVFVNVLHTLSRLELEADREPEIRFVRSQIIREPDLQTFEDGGEMETLELGTVTWQASVEPTAVPDLFEVELELRFAPPDQPPFERREVLWLLRPTWSDPAERSLLRQEMIQKIEEMRAGGDW